MAQCQCIKWSAGSLTDTTVVFQFSGGFLYLSSYQTPTDMPTNRLGRPAHKSYHFFFWGRRPIHNNNNNNNNTSPTRNLFPASANNIQWLRLRRDALEIHTATERSSRSPRGDCSGFLHRDKQERGRHHRCSNVQRHASASCAIFQQDTVFLFRGAETECWRDG